MLSIYGLLRIYKEIFRLIPRKNALQRQRTGRDTPADEAPES